MNYQTVISKLCYHLEWPIWHQYEPSSFLLRIMMSPLPTGLPTTMPHLHKAIPRLPSMVHDHGEGVPCYEPGKVLRSSLQPLWPPVVAPCHMPDSWNSLAHSKAPLPPCRSSFEKQIQGARSQQSMQLRGQGTLPHTRQFLFKGTDGRKVPAAVAARIAAGRGSGEWQGVPTHTQS